ncbi:MAG: argininosuccinate lyase [Anaerolineae bacterium]|nr:argininosuccinate lyase [Anaerolineae bacterium]
MRLWGGRFSGETDDRMRRFHDSFGFDRRLYAADIRGSVAYAAALLRAGLITDDERAAIVEGLGQVKQEFDDGTFEPLPGDEDIHTAVERRLTEIVGSPAGKLHTGRSRNDQIALDVRLWLIMSIDQVSALLTGVQSAIVDKAEVHSGLVMPGYTHLQAAQPVLFAHWLMSTFWMLERDRDRLADCRRRTAVCPLGSGALAGNPFAIDREALAADLGMESATPNSMDAVADRDFIAEFLFAAALIGIHTSRLAEDVVLYTSPGYRFLSIGEAYSTGSSLMPQKRNPDSMELARGKAGRLIGDLVSLLTVLKGLPSTYNKDMQEDKEPLFDAFDTLMLTLPVLAGVVGTITPHAEAMRAALDEAMLATDLADYLVRRGMPFREAHHISGRIVRRAEERDVPLSALALDDFRAESDVFESDVFTVFDFDSSVARRAVTGGTAPEAVAAQIDAARARLSSR